MKIFSEFFKAQKVKAIVFYTLLFLLPAFVVQGKMRVVVTNSWTAAYARAAGIEEMIQLAPSDMVHPSEYELQINDLAKIMTADLIIFAGYENVILQIKQSSKVDDSKFLQIETGYSESSIIMAIELIAEKAGSQKLASQSIIGIKKLFAEAKSEVKALQLENKPTIVHFFQKPFVHEIGLQTVGVIGPAPLELHELASLVKKKAVFIIDNYHNPVSSPLLKMDKRLKSLEFINFPGAKGTSSLEDVIRYNLSLLKSIK
jgi:zinc transport system substrate-binding protein